MNPEYDNHLQPIARTLKRRAALMSEYAAELETEAEKVLSLLARCREAKTSEEFETLAAEVTAYHQYLLQNAMPRWNQFVAAYNDADKES